MIGVFADVYAVCPANLNGKWIGNTVGTEDGGTTDAQGNFTPFHSVSNGVLSVVVNGTTATIQYSADSESGYYGGLDTTGAGTTVNITYDKSTCTGTISGDDYKFIVSNNGRTFQGVRYKQNTGSNADGSSFKSGKTSILTMQKQ